MSSLPFFLRDSRTSETRARVKITPREKRRVGECSLLSLRKNGGLLMSIFTKFPKSRHSYHQSVHLSDFIWNSRTKYYIKWRKFLLPLKRYVVVFHSQPSSYHKILSAGRCVLHLIHHKPDNLRVMSGIIENWRSSQFYYFFLSGRFCFLYLVVALLPWKKSKRSVRLMW